MSIGTCEILKSTPRLARQMQGRYLARGYRLWLDLASLFLSIPGNLRPYKRTSSFNVASPALLGSSR